MYPLPSAPLTYILMIFISRSHMPIVQLVVVTMTIVVQTYIDGIYK